MSKQRTTTKQIEWSIGTNHLPVAVYCSTANDDKRTRKASNHGDHGYLCIDEW